MRGPGRGKDEAMVSVKFFIHAGAACLISGAAFAADLPPPPVAYQPQVATCCESSGWYLRGQIGVGILNTPSLTYEQNPLNSSNFAFLHNDISDTVFIGGGLGYEVNNWLRFDATAEYRSKAEMTAFGTYTFGGGTFGDAYHAYLQSWVFLANAYVDLGTWDCITPFVGVGVGGAYNKIADLADVGIATSGTGVGRGSAAWSPAYAAYAGLAYNVSQNLKLELTYRYLNYGSTTDTIDCTGGCNPDSYKFGHFSSNDIMLGMRWMLNPVPAVVAPLSTRG
jgi:opacity protein-like surface antigen